MSSTNVFIRDAADTKVVPGPVNNSRLLGMRVSLASQEELGVLAITTEADDLGLFLDEGAALKLSEAAAKIHGELVARRTGA